MNVSSVSNSNWWYQLNALKKTNSSADTTTGASTTTAAGDSKSVFTNSDGDTFELSGTAPPPPPPGPPPASQAASSNATGSGTTSDSDPIKIFLDKVAGGTATQSDLTSIQSYLQQMQANSTGGTTGTTDADSTNGAHHRANALKDFLDKVADGSVTEADLTSMQSYLQQMQQKAVNGASAAGDSNSTATRDLLKVFLDKVTAGSVTKDDLASMQTYLQQMLKDQAS